MSLQDKIDKSILRLKGFEPPEGYYLAFSGGKDSIVIKALADMAGVKYQAFYNSTTIDPPELIYFIKEHHKDVKIIQPKTTFLDQLLKSGPPRRDRRWCCGMLKEKGGEGRVVITGVRWAESVKRSKRKPLELVTKNVKEKMLFEDNDEGRTMFENCVKKGKKVVNAIIEWTDKDVWDFIKINKIPYCKLYDEGWKRIGCLMCPMAGKSRITHKIRYPKIANNFIRYFEMYYTKNKHRKVFDRFESGLDMFNWWIKENRYVPPSQIRMFDEDELS